MLSQPRQVHSVTALSLCLTTARREAPPEFRMQFMIWVAATLAAVILYVITWAAVGSRAMRYECETAFHTDAFD